MDASNNMILDLGSDRVKAGTSADALPSLVFPTLVGQAVKKRNLIKKKAETEDNSGPKYIVGEDALQNGSKTSLVRPIKHGIVENWTCFEQIANHCFTDLGLNMEDTCVTIAEPVFNPSSCTDRLAQTFFETFTVSDMALLKSGVCALYASGRTTGIVLDSGDGVTQVTPVFDNCITPNAVNRINNGGSDVTAHLKRVLHERGYVFGADDDAQVQMLKEKLCYISLNYAEDLVLDEGEVEEKTYQLPDGQTVIASKERFRAPEIMFTPSIIHSEAPPLPIFLCKAVKTCAIDIRKPLLSNIVVCGGNTMFPGFGDRMKEEVKLQFTGLFSSIAVSESPNRLYSTYAGASVVSNLSSFKSMIVTKAMYDEEGPNVLREHQGGGGDDDEEPPED